MEHGEEDLQDLPEPTLRHGLLVETLEPEQARRVASCVARSDTEQPSVQKAS
jgi:hypothetical protein